MLKKLGCSILLLTLLLISSSTFAAKVITLATSTWEPYVSENPAYKGYASSIVEHAFKAAGYEVHIKFMPWQDALRAVKSGQVDGLFPKYYSAEDAQQFAFTHAFSGGPIGLYKRRSDASEYPTENPTANLVETFHHMEGATFGVVKGYTNFPAFDNNSRLKKVAVADDKANLDQLYEGKVQYAVIDKYVAEYLLNHKLPANYSKKLMFMPPILSYKLLYVVISKKNPQQKEIVDAFNKGLAKIKQNGKMAQILDQDAKENGSEIS